MKKRNAPARICFDCEHYHACSAMTIGTLRYTDATHCSNFTEPHVLVELERDRLKSTVSQVSKALCGKENATLEELLAAADQLKTHLSQVERERDAMHRDMKLYSRCKACKRFVDGLDCPVHTECTYGGKGLFEWRGVCEENTKDHT